MKNTKIKYEAPLIFDLASRGRMQGVLADCAPGSVANQNLPCTSGSGASPDDCVNNGSVASADCKQGSSATSLCFAGCVPAVVVTAC